MPYDLLAVDTFFVDVVMWYPSLACCIDCCNVVLCTSSMRGVPFGNGAGSSTTSKIRKSKRARA